MAAYKPAQPPLFTRLFKNWIFQLSAFVFIVIVGVSLIRAKNRANFSDSLASLEGATSKQKNFLSKKPIDKKFAQTPNGDSSNPSASNSPSAKAGGPVPAPTFVATDTSLAGGQQEVTSGLQGGAGLQGGTTKLADGSGDGANFLPTKLRLVFAELNRGTFAAILGDTRSIASFGVYFSGLLPDQQDKTKSDLAGIILLDSANDLQIKLNQPVVVFKGSRDPQLQQNIGLTTQITPTFIDEHGAHLQIEMKRTLRSPAGVRTPLVEENFQEQMILKKGSRGFISGLLPHRILSEEEARTLSSNPTILKVLSSNDFQNGNSEFVIFVEAK